MKKVITFMLIVIMCLSLIGCGKSKKEVKNIPVADIMAAVEKEVEFRPMENFQSGDILNAQYYIKDEDVEEYIIKKAMMNVSASEITIIKAKDESKVEAIKNGVEKRQEDLDKQGAQYLPDQHELVKNAKIKVVGNYVIFIVDEESEKIEKIIDSQLK